MRHALARVPIRDAAADAEDEIGQILPAARGVHHFGMKLHAVELALAAAAMAATAQVSVRPATAKPAGGAATTSRWLIQICCRPGEAGEQRVGGVVQFERGQAVFALFAAAHLAAQQVRHQLLPVADAEHRLAGCKDGGVHGGDPGRKRCSGRPR